MKCDADHDTDKRKRCERQADYSYKVGTWPRMHYCAKHAMNLMGTKNLTRVK